MAIEQEIYDISLDADADLSDNQFHVIAGTGAFICGLAGAADEDAIGILQNDPDAAGVAAEIRRVGISKGVCGGAIPVWSEVTSDANGHLVVAAAGERYIGLAMEVGAALRIISVLMEFGTVPEGS